MTGIRHSMGCPRCGRTASVVNDVRNTEAFIRRRRRCTGCGALYTTRERVEQPMAVPLPWLAPPLDAWLIAGMQHVRSHGQVLLTVTMVRNGVSITAQGVDQVQVFDTLARAAYKSMQLTTAAATHIDTSLRVRHPLQPGVSWLER